MGFRQNRSTHSAPELMTPTDPVGGDLSKNKADRKIPEQLAMLFYLARWIPIAAVTGVMAGSASALVLVSLEWAPATGESHKWIIALLPVAGLAVGCLYRYLGSSVEAGNNLI